MVNEKIQFTNRNEPQILSLVKSPQRVREALERVEVELQGSPRDFSNDAIGNIAALFDTEGSQKALSGSLSSASVNLDDITVPSILVDLNGIIEADNLLARRSFATFAGQHVDGCEFSPSMSEKVGQALLELHSNPGSLVQTYAWATLNGHPIGLRIDSVSLEDASSLGLRVMIFASNLSSRTKNLLEKKFKLTKSEIGVVSEFFSGKSLKAISQEQSRTVATVRAHFYSAMKRMDVNSQPEIMRIIAAFEAAYQKNTDISPKARKPFRNEVSLMRQNGRVLEVCDCGDPEGQVVLSLSNSIFRCFSSENERLLRKKNLRFIAVSPPGYGRTSPPSSGEDYIDCLQADVVSLLDQLQVPSADILAANCSLVSAVELATRIPNRINHIITCQLIAPHPYPFGVGNDGSFFGLLRRLLAGSQLSRSLAISISANSLTALGALDSAFMLFSDRSKEFKSMLHAEIMEEVDNALTSASAQGLNAIKADVERSLSDWRRQLRECPSPILSVREKTPLFTSDEDYSAFVDEFEDQIETVFQEKTGPLGNLIINVMSDLYASRLGAQD